MTLFAIHGAVVIVEHPDIFLALLDNKVLGNSVLHNIFRAGEKRWHQCTACACTQALDTQIQSALQFAAGLYNVIIPERFT